jgi:glycosyltransferase involved in cell wall biosynthesis
MAISVVHIITKLELGGAQQNTLFTVAHLDRARFSPILISGEPGYLDAEARALPDVPFHQVASLRRPLHPVKDIRALFDLTRLLRAFKPDIVHTHSSKAGILGRWAAHRANVPVIIHTIHGFGITPDQPAAVRRSLLAAERWAGRFTTRFFAVSHATREAGIRYGLFDGDRCAVVRSGIDIAAYRHRQVDTAAKRKELGLVPDRPVVGMVGPMKPQKAPLDFVRIARQVQEARPDVQFLYVGEGELRGAMEAEIVRLSPAGYIRLVGWRRDIPDVMRVLNVFLLTSRWEGLPRVCLEALASGVPVVATAVDGTPEAVVDGVNGYLHAPGDVAGMAGHVLQLLDKPDEARRMGEAGQALPAEFEIREMVRRQETEYAALANSRATSNIPVRDASVT